MEQPCDRLCVGGLEVARDLERQAWSAKKRCFGMFERCLRLLDVGEVGDASAGSPLILVERLRLAEAPLPCSETRLLLSGTA